MCLETEDESTDKRNVSVLLADKDILLYVVLVCRVQWIFKNMFCALCQWDKGGRRVCIIHTNINLLQIQRVDSEGKLFEADPENMTKVNCSSYNTMCSPLPCYEIIYLFLCGLISLYTASKTGDIIRSYPN